MRCAATVVYSCLGRLIRPSESALEGGDSVALLISSNDRVLLSTQFDETLGGLRSIA